MRGKYQDIVRTSGVERGGGANAGPDRSLEAHSLRDGTNTVVDITVRGAPEVGGDTQHILDDLLAPSELSDDLLVGEGSHRRVAPGVDSNLVLSHVLLLQESRVGDRTRTDDEERRLEVGVVEVGEKFASVESGTVVVSETPSHLVRALNDIIVVHASTARPPAAAGVRSRLGVRTAATGNGRSNVGDGNAGRVDLLDPLLNLGGANIGRLVQSRIVGRVEAQS